MNHLLSESFVFTAAVETRIMKSIAPQEYDFTKDLVTVTRKFYGGRAGDKPADDPATPGIDESLAAHSVSQRSYDNLAASFADLVALLKTQSSYNPNEDEVKITTLETKLDAFQTKNNAVKAAEAARGNALNARDAVLYDPETGILKLVKLVKTHLAAPGKASAAYQQVNALKFRKS